MIDLTAEVTIKIPFQDVDIMGVVWHGNYLRYFEEARAALLDKIDYGYFKMRESGYAWPIVDARVKYIKPLTLHQVVHVKARLVEYECGIKIDYEVYDSETGERATKGKTTQVAVDMRNHEMCLASPRVFLEKLGAAI